MLDVACCVTKFDLKWQSEDHVVPRSKTRYCCLNVSLHSFSGDAFIVDGRRGSSSHSHFSSGVHGQRSTNHLSPHAHRRHRGRFAGGMALEMAGVCLSFLFFVV